MEDTVDALDEGVGLAVSQVALDESEARLRARTFEVRLLDLPRVVVGECVYPDDLVTPLEERLREVGADEPGTPGDQVAAQWQDPVPESVKLPPSTGRNSQS